LDRIRQWLGQLSLIGPKEEWLRESIFSKYVSEDTDPSVVRRQRAINKWLAVERENEATNTRLLLTDEEYNILPRVTWRSFVSRARFYVSKVLGETVPGTILLGGAFSGGASTSRSRLESHPTLKYLGKAEITSAAQDWFLSFMEESPLWTSYIDEIDISISPGNVLFTVPKSTDIDRCAAKEPDLNMYMQRSAGNYIRWGLRSQGINLNDQSVNRELARLGSINDSLATLDLSSASDSVSTELVALLLPDLWFSFLNAIRSQETCIDGEWHKNEMFSSMGNGFTFELESLLFWAVSSSVRDLLGCTGCVSVYGDDIIVEPTVADALLWVLPYVGFSVNESKSFIRGPFRESCGGHYYRGCNITPIYIRKPITRIRDAITFANQLRRWAELADFPILDDVVYPLWEYIASLVPKRFWGGTNLESSEQLVSVARGYSRLVELSKDKHTGHGGYLHWLDTCEDRAELWNDALVSSQRKISKGIFRVRRAVAEVRYPPCVFLAEIRMDPGIQEE